MRHESGHIEGPSVLASTTGAPPVLAPSAAGAAAGSATADVALTLRGIGRLRKPRALRVPNALREARAGKIALATIVGAVLVMVLFSTHGPTILVPRSSQIFASWE